MLGPRPRPSRVTIQNKMTRKSARGWRIANCLPSSALFSSMLALVSRLQIISMSVSADTDVFKKWFPAYKSARGNPRLRIISFHNAGSAENTITGPVVRDKKRIPNRLMEWAEEAGAEVMAVQLPGREMRRSEPFLAKCQEAAEALLPVIEPKIKGSVPYCVVAHSVGNWVAFETLRLARQRGLPMPCVFFSSCMPSPDIREDLKPWRPNRSMGEAEMQQECRLWDVNQAVFQPSVWPMFEPMLRADFALFDEYMYDPAGSEPFDFPIHAYFAIRDRKVTREMVEGWRNFTTSEFSIECVKGNHLFVYDHAVRDAWFDMVTEVLTAEGF